MPFPKLPPGGYHSVADALLEGTWTPPPSRIRMALRRINGSMLRGRSPVGDLKELGRLPHSQIRDLEGRLAENARESELSMRVEPVTLQKILEDNEIKNQHQTGTSNGSFEPDGRRRFEQQAFGYNPNAPIEELPKYGYSFLSRGWPRYSGLDSYGPVRLTLDPELKKRSTIYYGDSLHTTGQPLPYLRPRRISIDNLDTIGSGNVRDDLLEVIKGNIEPENLTSLYTEAQIHGPLPASAIKGVTYPREWNHFDRDYAAKMREALDAHGIPHESTESSRYAGGGYARMPRVPRSMRLTPGPKQLAGGGSASSGRSLDEIVRLLRTEVPSRMGKPALGRLDRLRTEVPRAHELYDPRQLAEMLTGNQRLAAIRPGAFERAARPIDYTNSDEITGPLPLHHLSPDRIDNIDKLRDLMRAGKPFDSVPWLEVGVPGRGIGAKSWLEGLTDPLIAGHEGRHRNRALDLEGVDRGLVRLFSDNSSGDRAIENMGPGSNFIPELYGKAKRGPAQLPYSDVFASEPFARGGLAMMSDRG